MLFDALIYSCLPWQRVLDVGVYDAFRKLNVLFVPLNTNVLLIRNADSIHQSVLCLLAIFMCNDFLIGLYLFGQDILTQRFHRRFCLNTFQCPVYFLYELGHGGDCIFICNISYLEQLYYMHGGIGNLSDSIRFRRNTFIRYFYFRFGKVHA